MHGMRLRQLGAGLVTTALVGAGNVLMPPNAWAAGVTLPVRVIKAHGEALVVAPVQIQGRTYPFVIDTGASKSSVDVHLARLLHLRRVGRPIHVLGVGGRASSRSIACRSGNWPVPPCLRPTSMAPI